MQVIESTIKSFNFDKKNSEWKTINYNLVSIQNHKP